MRKVETIKVSTTKTGDFRPRVPTPHINPIQVRYLAALHPDRFPVILTKILA